MPIAAIISIIIAIISAIITYVMSDKSTPEKKKAALGMALGVGAAAGTLASATGLSDNIAGAFSDSTSAQSGNPFTGDPVTVQTQDDGTVRYYYPEGYYDIKPDGSTAAFNSDGTSKPLLATASGLTATNAGTTGNGKILGAQASGTNVTSSGSPASTSSWLEKLGLVGGGVALGAAGGTIPWWMIIAGGVVLILVIGD